jgi:ParB/RepB/Spo0J family partition protein
MKVAAMAMVSLKRLKPSTQVNAREFTEDEIDSLVSSIKARGLILPLAVRENGKGFEIIDGRRRFEALCRLVKAKVIPADYAVPVAVRDEGEADALETSLVANVVRLPMAAVEQYEVMAGLIDKGKTEADLAATFGLAEKAVRQILSLGRLAPAIRAAWKAGQIDAKVAKAFTVVSDHARQEKVFKELRSRGPMWEGQVRAALSVDGYEMNSGLMKFIGSEYRAAKGPIAEDLFDKDGGGIALDGRLAERLAREKLEAEIEKTAKQGWAWVAHEEDMPPDWRYHYRRLAPDQIKAGKHTAGVVICIDPSGKISKQVGVLKPDKRPAKQKAEKAEPAAERVAQALANDLDRQFNAAIADAVKQDGLLALRVLEAVLVSGSGPTLLRMNLARPNGAGAKRPDFSTALAETSSHTPMAIASSIARLVPSIMDCGCSGAARGDSEAVQMAINEKTYVVHARKAFQPRDYFSRISREQVMQAVAEMNVEPQDVPSPKIGKTDLAKHVADLACKTGWLPKPLRHPASKKKAKAP